VAAQAAARAQEAVEHLTEELARLRAEAVAVAVHAAQVRAQAPRRAWKV